MVFVNIPAQLTEEELMLRQKYQMLKRKVIKFDYQGFQFSNSCLFCRKNNWFNTKHPKMKNSTCPLKFQLNEVSNTI